MNMDIKIKRAYEPADACDGFRVYVDRLWPRGMSHETFKYDLWVKDVSPSATLREWFHVDRTGRWTEFIQRFSAELEKKESDGLAQLRQLMKEHDTLTLLYSSKDEAHNNAVVLREVLLNRVKNKTDS